MKMNGNNVGDMKQKLNGYINEYLASGVADDIIELNCHDVDIWKDVINDSLRDKRTSEIDNFIDLIMEMFKKNVLSNKGAQFINVVINHLAKELDESSMDCPKFKNYIAKLFAKLCYNGYLKPDPCYNFFIKKYKEHSEYQSIAQKKTINKIIQYSIDELQHLKAKQSLISKIKKYLL